MTSVCCQRKLKINSFLTMFVKVALIFGKKKRLLRQLLSQVLACANDNCERVHLLSGQTR